MHNSPYPITITILPAINESQELRVTANGQTVVHIGTPQEIESLLLETLASTKTGSHETEKDRIEALEIWKASAAEILSGWEQVASLFGYRPEDLGRKKSEVVHERIQTVQSLLR